MSKQTVSRVRFSGGLDISRYPEIVDAFRSCGDGKEPLIVDLDAVAWIDSFFVSELLMFVRRNPRSRRIVIVAKDNVERMLSITGINKKLQVVPTFEAATELIE